ncbi:MAG: SWIM zinc finger family protein [Candidatus Binataceae bacterium]
MRYRKWWRYVSVAQRRLNAKKKVAEFSNKRQAISPVTIEGRAIAKSFWGKSWCANLERYSDYENRLPRGRTYLRNGSVFDLHIAKSKVSAVVLGSEFYKVTIAIAPVTATRWKAICRDCAGTIDSLVELLQGRLSKAVMDRVCREDDGLFPAPKEIKLSCSCPDWAGMCKHVAAVLYGVGARLDETPALLFALRGVDENDLLANAGQELSLKKAAPAASKVLDDGDVAALFGLDMAETVRSGTRANPKGPQQRKSLSGKKTRAGKKSRPAPQNS